MSTTSSTSGAWWPGTTKKSSEPERIASYSSTPSGTVSAQSTRPHSQTNPTRSSSSGRARRSARRRSLISRNRLSLSAMRRARASTALPSLSDGPRREDRDVIPRIAALERHDARLDRLRDDGRILARVLAQQLVEQPLAGARVVAPQLRDAVGEHDQQVAGREPRVGLPEHRRAQAADDRAAQLQALERPVGAQDARRH